MTTPACPSYAGYRFPAEVISHAVWRRCQVVDPGAVESLGLIRASESLRLIRASESLRLIRASESLRLIRASRSGCYADHLAPGAESSVPGSTVLVGGQAMAAELEVVVDAAVDGQEALGMAG